jgi:hypothetical protein
MKHQAKGRIRKENFLLQTKNIRRNIMKLTKERRKKRKMKKENNPDALEEARFFYDLVTHLYRQTYASNNLLNQKIYNMIMITGTVTLVLTGLLYRVFFDLRKLVPVWEYQCVIIPVILGLVFLFISIIFGLCLQKSWTFKGINPKTFARDFYGKGLLKSIEQAISELLDAIEKNDKRINRKALFYHMMLILASIGTFCLVLGFVLLMIIN